MSNNSAIRLALEIYAPTTVTVSIILNSILILIILCDKDLRKVNANIYVINSSLAIIVAALGTFAIMVAIFTDSISHHPHLNFCLILCGIIIALLSIEVHSLMFISIDRFIGVLYPFIYQSYIAQYGIKAGIIISIIIWFISTFIMCFPLAVGWHEPLHQNDSCKYHVVIPATYRLFYMYPLRILIPIIIMIILNFYIYLLIRRIRRRTAALSVFPVAAKAKNSTNSMQKNTARTIFSLNLTIVFLAIFKLPLFLMDIIFFFTRQPIDDDIFSCLVMLGNLDRISVPLVYLISNPRYRNALKERVRAMGKCFHHSPKTSKSLDLPGTN